VKRYLQEATFDGASAGATEDAPEHDLGDVAATMPGGERPQPEALFDGFFCAGFECSDHRLANGVRLDLLASTRHDELADADYERLRGLDIRTCREGASWVRCEPRRGVFDFSTLLERLRAASRHAVQIIWDLMHFGWPDDLEIFAPTFPQRFGSYAKSLARFLSQHAEPPFLFSPINEMSFLAWAGGDVRVLNPFAAARGVELKCQLVLATIEAIEAIRLILPRARFLQPEPIIQIVANPDEPRTFARIYSDNLLQFQAWDMLSGRVFHSLGGDPKYLDVLGVNFYPDNQFTLAGTTIMRGDARYRPLSHMLCDVQARYGRPMMISETGSEGAERASWLRYVAEECLTALHDGCDLHGITLYPVLDHPGWLDGRHCENGLWGYPDAHGRREVHEPLAAEVRVQSARLEHARRCLWARQMASGLNLSDAG
jgi:hypothetical protein